MGAEPVALIPHCAECRRVWRPAERGALALLVGCQKPGSPSKSARSRGVNGVLGTPEDLF